MYAYGYFNSFNLLGGGVSLDPDAQAFITAAAITDPTQQAAVNTAVLSLKSGTLWNKGSVILPYIGGNATSHRVNLKTATNGVQFFGGITHNSNGVTYNGTTGYGVVEFQVTTSNQYNRSVVQYVRNQTTLDSASWQGAYNGTHVFGFQNSSQSGYRLVSDGLNRLSGVVPSPSIIYGSIGAVVSASNSAKMYNLSGVVYSINNPNATPNNNLKMYSGALNNSGSAILYSGSSLGFEYYGEGLSDSEYSELNSIIVAFNTTLGRNV